MRTRSRLRAAARRQLFRLGLDVERFPRTHTLAGLLHEILVGRSVDAVVDVGANEGQFGRLVRSIGYQGPIVSFEPVDEPRRVLLANAADAPPWSVHDVALGAEAGTHTMNVAGETMLSSMRTAASGYQDLLLDDASTVSRPVRVDTLDAVAADDPVLRGATRMFLKTDTQGFDHEVLQGATGTIDRLVGIQIELAVHHIYEDVPDWHDLIEVVEGLGFQLAGIHPTNTDRHLRLVDVDGVFVRAPDR